MGFSRQEYWSGLLFPPLGDLPNPEIEPESLRSPALAGRFFTTSTPLGVFTCTHRKISNICMYDLELREKVRDINVGLISHI